MSTNLYKLLSWMSPAYPVGAYTFSHGLESAIEQGLLRDEATVQQWIADILEVGNGHADLVFAGAAWDAGADVAALRRINEFALAFQPSAELRLESTEQGAAFATVTAAAWPSPAIARLEMLGAGYLAYPVAIGASASAHDIGKLQTLTSFAHAFAGNLVSAAVRLVPLGQTAGQRMTAWLSPCCVAAAECAAQTHYEDVATATIMAEIVSMNHETQYSRLFRS